MYVCVYVCMYKYVYVYVYVHMHSYINVYVCMHVGYVSVCTRASTLRMWVSFLRVFMCALIREVIDMSLKKSANQV